MVRTIGEIAHTFYIELSALAKVHGTKVSGEPPTGWTPSSKASAPSPKPTAAKAKAMASAAQVLENMVEFMRKKGIVVGAVCEEVATKRELIVLEVGVDSTRLSTRAKPKACALVVKNIDLFDKITLNEDANTSVHTMACIKSR